MAESNTQKVLRVLLSPAADLEAAMQQVLTERSIDTAVGAQLDAIGARVGRSREGVTDDEIYRRYVRAQIAANKSDGTMRDIYTVARLVVDDPAAILVIKNEGPATFVLAVHGIALSAAVAKVMFQLMRRAASGGVRALLEYTTADPGDVLFWSTQGVWGTQLWAGAVDREI
jgi:Protein of unknown function (DUF2612)